MINQADLIKYPAPDFESGPHLYSVGGKSIYGFSEIAKAMGIINYSAVPVHIRERAMAIGSAIHLGCEYWDRGTLDESSLSDDTRGPVDAWKDFRQCNKFEPIVIELPMQNQPYRYCCTPDRVGLLDGKLTLVEIKTGEPQPWHMIQIEAQMLCLKKKMQKLIVQLKKDGTWSPHIIKDGYKFCKKTVNERENRMIWLSAVSLYHWKKENC